VACIFPFYLFLNSELGYCLDQIRDTQQAEQLPVINNRKTAEFSGNQDPCCFLNGSIRADGNRVRCHQETQLGLFRFPEKILPGNNTNQFLALPYGNTADPGPFENFEYIVPVSGNFDGHDVLGHEL